MSSSKKSPSQASSRRSANQVSASFNVLSSDQIKMANAGAKSSSPMSNHHSSSVKASSKSPASAHTSSKSPTSAHTSSAVPSVSSPNSGFSAHSASGAGQLAHSQTFNHHQSSTHSSRAASSLHSTGQSSAMVSTSQALSSPRSSSKIMSKLSSRSKPKLRVSSAAAHSTTHAASAVSASAVPKSVSNSSQPQPVGQNPEEGRAEPTQDATIVPYSSVPCEFILASAAALIFLGSFIAVTAADCGRDTNQIWLFKVFTSLGCISATFVAIFFCFSNPKGGTGNLLTTILICCVSVMNLIGAYFAMSCFCKCQTSPFSYPNIDLVLLLLQVLGSLLFLTIVFMSACKGQT